MEVSFIKKGYTFTEVIISITILTFISPFFIDIINKMISFPEYLTERQNFMGIIQLRRSLSLGIEHDINDFQVCMVYKDEMMCFEQYESNLIAHPGTQYFLVKVDDIVFSIIDDWLMIDYISNLKNYSYKLIKL